MSRDARTPDRLSILLIDPHEVSRAAIRALLETEGLELVVDVATGEEALALGDSISPDLAIVDVGRATTPALAKLDALAGLPSRPIIVITSSAASDMNAGGHAFVPKRDLCAHRLRLEIGAARPDRGVEGALPRHE